MPEATRYNFSRYINVAILELKQNEEIITSPIIRNKLYLGSRAIGDKVLHETPTFFHYFSISNMKRQLPKDLKPRNSKTSTRMSFVLIFIFVILNKTNTGTAFVPPHSTSTQPGNSQHFHFSRRKENTGRMFMKKKRPMPVVGYNSDEICKYYDMRPLVVGWRLNKLSLPLLGWYLGLLQDKLLNRDSPAVQRMRGAQLRQSLASSGSVALIKSGQALSLRPDLLKNMIWSQELGKLVDEVGSFNDFDAMKIINRELSDLPVLRPTAKSNNDKKKSRLEKMSEADPILSLFEFQNSNLAVASASIGQVYKARIKRGAQLEAAIGKEEAKKWGGKLVAIKVQRPDVAAAASLDMYLLRRTATWLSTFRGGDLEGIADAFGIQLFGELDYVREANNCARFRELYGDWDRVTVPEACFPLTRKRVLVMEWIDGEKGPWDGALGIDMVSLGLKCSVDQLLNTGLFHADPHRGNLLRDKSGNLVFIDFGMMADVSEEERYGLVGLVIGLQTKDLPLITEKLLDVGIQLMYWPYLFFVSVFTHFFSHIARISRRHNTT